MYSRSHFKETITISECLSAVYPPWFSLQDNMQPNGGKLEAAETFDWFMHFFTFGLKILFSSCPPPGLYRGWPAFFVSLIYIGFMAALVR